MATKKRDDSGARLPELLSVANAALMVGVSRMTLHRLIAAGELHAVYVPGVAGRKLRRADVQAWLAGLDAGVTKGAEHAG